MSSPQRNQQLNSNTSPDEKEMKAKRKYYGKIFVSLIFMLIVYEYYVYVYQISYHKITGKIENKYR